MMDIITIATERAVRKDVQTPATSCVLCPVFKNPFSINRGEASE
jgi:hypothetical protein